MKCRIIEAGRNLWRSSSPVPCSEGLTRAGCSAICPVWVWPSQGWRLSTLSEQHAPVFNNPHWKELNRNFTYLCWCLLSLVLSLGTTEMSSSFPHIKNLNTLMRWFLPWAFFSPAAQFQLSQPPLICRTLQSLNHLHDPAI